MATVGSAWVGRDRRLSVFGGCELVARDGDSASELRVGEAFQQRAAVFSVDGSMESCGAEPPTGKVGIGDTISAATGEVVHEMLWDYVAC